MNQSRKTKKSYLPQKVQYKDLKYYLHLYFFKLVKEQRLIQAHKQAPVQCAGYMRGKYGTNPINSNRMIITDFSVPITSTFTDDRNNDGSGELKMYGSI